LGKESGLNGCQLPILSTVKIPTSGKAARSGAPVHPSEYIRYITFPFWESFPFFSDFFCEFSCLWIAKKFQWKDKAALANFRNAVILFFLGWGE
jgi:hypothetical protein